MTTATETFHGMEIIRSTPLPMDNRGGTRLFCVFDGAWFRVTTRFEQIGKSKNIDKALALFEKTEMEGP